MAKKKKGYYKRQFLEPSKQGNADSYMVTYVSEHDGRFLTAEVKLADCTRSVCLTLWSDEKNRPTKTGMRKLNKMIEQLTELRDYLEENYKE